MKWVPDKLQLKGLEFLLTRQAAAQARRNAEWDAIVQKGE